MEGFCRGCLIKYDEPTDLIPYSEKNRRLFVYSTGLQVKRNDAFTFQLCKDCYLNMKESCTFKKLCRTSDKKFKNYIALKEDGDTLDFCSYLKNNEESLMLKLPALVNANSTPAHHKNQDDDNESTCTSIRNFMSDILQGEEVPDTEARIIKELFEEEADVLDDSLDSHWLQDEDDMSIATDFRMDFSFSPFSTPHSINNDHCYTPHRIDDDKYADKPDKYHNMPLLEDESAIDIDHVADIPMDDIPNDIYIRNQDDNLTNENHDFNSLSHKNSDIFGKDKGIALKFDPEKDNSSLLINKDINTNLYGINHVDCVSGLFNKDKELEEGISLDKDNQLLNKHFNILSEGEVVEDGTILVKDLLNTEDSTQEFIAPTEIENDFLKMTDEHVKKQSDESIIKDEIDFYVHKVDEKRKKNEHNKCSIDRNLELALLNEQNREFSLEQLISSPREHINSGASTPTIRNIIFGNQTPKYFNNDNKVEKIMKDEITAKEDQINNTDSLSLHSSSLESVPNLTENIKQDVLDTNVDKSDLTTKNSEDDIINLIKEDTYKNHEQIQKVNTEIKIKDITELIEDYVTNVYENPDSNALKNDELDNLLATVIPDLEDQKTPKNDRENDKDSFKKPTPPDEQYDLENALCKICNKQFNLEIALRIHFSKIHKVKITPRKRLFRTEKCTLCEKTFKGKANLIRHTKDAHSDTKEKHVCVECYMEFKTKYGLNQHRRTHKDFVPKVDQCKHLCTFCGKYLNKTNYMLHKLKHQNIYKFKCDICSKQFSRQWELDRHMSKHTKEKPFGCSFCKKAYTRRDMLKRHLQMHTHGYRYECNECSSRFISKEAIRKHLVTSACPGPYVNKEVTMNNIVLIPMGKLIKVKDVKIIKKPINSNYNKQNDDEQMITDDEQTKIINEGPLDSTDDKQINKPVTNVNQLTKLDDNPSYCKNDDPMKRSDDIGKPLNSKDDKPMDRSVSKEIMNSIEKSRNNSDNKSMENSNGVEITDVTVKIQRIDMKEDNPSDDTTNLSMSAAVFHNK